MVYLKNKERFIYGEGGVSGSCPCCHMYMTISNVILRGNFSFHCDNCNTLVSEREKKKRSGENKNKITRYNFKGPVHIDKLCADTLKDNKKCFMVIQQDTVICGMLAIWSIGHPLLGTDVYNSVTTLVAETRYPFSLFTTTKDNIGRLIPEMKRFTAAIIKAEHKAQREINQWRKERMDNSESEVLVF